MSLDPTGHRALDTILTRLERVRHVGSRGWVATCPSHDDGTPSLSLTIGSDRQVLMLCRANCPTEKVLEALGLTMADLFERTEVPRRLVRTYDYCDDPGTLLYQVCRYDPKDFRVRRPDGRGGHIWNVRGVNRVLYRLPELLASDPNEPVLIVEGEKDVDRLLTLGLVATTNLGGAGKWRSAYNEAFRGRRIAILPDNDEPGRAHAVAVAIALELIAGSIATIELPGLPPKGDVSDWLDAGRTVADLLRLIEGGTKTVPDSHLAVTSVETQPTLADTLDGVAAHLTRFVHFAGPAYADAIALWVAHTHIPLERLEQSPILALTSAVKQSGKTKVLDVLEFLVARPWRITRPSEAVIFRKIDRDHPTVLLDEVDTIFADKSGTTEGIRSVFNSGNRHGTKVPRTVAQGRTFTLVEFDVFCPKATAGIGGLPDTILDRAIVIPMERRSRRERHERLRERTARRLGTPLRDALASVVAGIEDLSLPDDALPVELDERAQDGWEPLLALADAAGADWPGRARAAAIATYAQRSASDDSFELRLLIDCRTVFEAREQPFLATVELLEGLCAIEDAPWADIRGKSVTPHYVAKLLRGFKVTSTRHRVGGVGNPIRGYLRADFEDPWDRYGTPPGTDTSGTSGTSGTVAPAQGVSARADVPDVPDVPIARDMRLEEELAVTRAAWRIFGDDIDWVVGTA